MLSSVDGVESPGPEFMESVFALKPGQSGVAANRPHSFVYVVRVVSESPDEAQRRKQFVESGISRATFEIATLEQWKFLDDWYRHLEDEMKVTWKRPAMTAAESAEF
jgi:hypothetical protein